ncbi:hypothetical protein ASG43_01170 [Aureimonas sp. Leaf454]|nr:hypothetical protein ASG43_01170 [Aureimonas sp. Leaf454]
MSTPGYNLDESPLARLASRRGKGGEPFLCEAETVAGERLRADFTRAGLTPGVTQRWDGTPGKGRGGSCGGADLSDMAIDAKRRVDAAVTAVGPELSGILLDVCCFLKGLEIVERERQWPARSAKLLLKAGLGALARHYGLIGTASAGHGGMRSWGSDGYRPTMNAASRSGLDHPEEKPGH